MAVIKTLVNINLNGNEIQNAVAHVLSSAPANPVAGQFYYDSTLSAFGYYDGTKWVYQPAQIAYSAASLASDSTSVFAIYDSTDTTNGKEFKFRAVASGDDYIAITKGSDSAHTLTFSLNNIAISKVTNLQSALDDKLDDSQLSTRTTLVEEGESVASDTKIPSQKAVKAYVDDKIQDITTSLVGAMRYIGTWDGTKTIAQNLAAAETADSNYTTVKKGDLWKVSVAGTASGISTPSSSSLSVGDNVLANSDVAFSSAAAANFDGIDNTEAADIVRTSDINATSTLAASSTTTIPSEYTVAQALSNLSNAAVHQYSTTVTEGTSATIALATHGCGSSPDVSVYQLSGTDYVKVVTDVKITSAGAVTVAWNGAASSASSIKIVITGKPDAA
jgi:hypothetical protein